MFSSKEEVQVEEEVQKVLESIPEQSPPALRVLSREVSFAREMPTDVPPPVAPVRSTRTPAQPTPSVLARRARFLDRDARAVGATLRAQADSEVPPNISAVAWDPTNPKDDWRQKGFFQSPDPQEEHVQPTPAE
jgi:hypothetical protein